MASAPDVSSSTEPRPREEAAGHIDAAGLQYLVFGLFFIFGGITSLNDIVIPKLKELFTLNYTQAMLVQFGFFSAYLPIGIPVAKLVKKIDRFVAKGRFERCLEAIPVKLVTHQQPGLYGAAAAFAPEFA